jgi:hypothetical protein
MNSRGKFCAEVLVNDRNYITSTYIHFVKFVHALYIDITAMLSMVYVCIRDLVEAICRQCNKGCTF